MYIYVWLGQLSARLHCWMLGEKGKKSKIGEMDYRLQEMGERLTASSFKIFLHQGFLFYHVGLSLIKVILKVIYGKLRYDSIEQVNRK